MCFIWVRTAGLTRLLIIVFLSSLAPNCKGQQSATRTEQNKPSDIQPNDIQSGKYDNYMTRDDRFLCTRACRPNEPRLCYYMWMLTAYDTLNRACGNCPDVQSDCFLPQCISADGYEKAILVVERMLPGPSIQVCKGDTIIVDVVNELPGRSTTIHWHGMHQRGTPWMDGVPYITQCPIHEAETFRYRFRADEAGTSFWHSHDGLQKVDGVVGSFIVREPEFQNPLRSYYDFDLPSHVVLIEDWLHTPADERFPGFFRFKIRGQMPASYLINGRGVQVVNKTELVGNTPLSEFKVRSGYRYRFRLIGASCLSCPYRLTVQDHRMLAIAIDRNPIEPIFFDSIVLSAGERYDMVLEASQPADAYYIFVEGLGDCDQFSQVAVLRYEGAPSRPTVPLRLAFPDTDAGFMLNPRNSMCNDASLPMGRCVSQLQGLSRNPAQITRPAPDIRVLLTFNFHVFENKELFYSGTFHDYFVAPSGAHIAGQMNNRSNTSPPSPLLTQFWDIPPEVFCENMNCSRDGSKVCDCVNLVHVPLNSVVEFMLVHADPPNEAMLTHPFHIHGHDFYVVEEGMLPAPYITPEGETFVRRKLNQNRRNLSPYLPMKDTVSVPTQGFTITRITADNPGFWFFHCHFAYHQETGMSITIWDGELEDIPPPPPGFPECGDFISLPMQLLPDPRTFRTF